MCQSAGVRAAATACRTRVRTSGKLDCIIAPEAKSNRSRVAMLKTSGDHADRHKQSVGCFFGQRLSESLDSIKAKSARRLRTGVHQPQAAQIVLGLMMVDDDLGGRQSAEKRT